MKKRLFLAVLLAIGSSVASAVPENYYLMKQIEQERNSLLKEIRQSRQRHGKTTPENQPATPPPVATTEEKTETAPAAEQSQPPAPEKAPAQAQASA